MDSTPVPSKVKYCVHALACRDPRGLQFLNLNQQPISAKGADKDDGSYVPIDSDDDATEPYDYPETETNTATATLPDPPYPDHAYTNDEGNNTIFPDNAFTRVHPKDESEEPDRNPGVEDTGASNTGVPDHDDSDTDTKREEPPEDPPENVGVPANDTNPPRQEFLRSNQI